MREFTVLIRKELKEQMRTKKVLILAIIFLFVAIASPIIAKLTPELLKNISTPGLTINLPDPTYKDSLDQFIKNISQIGLLVLVFVVAGTVSDEKARKTLEIVLTKPVSRAKFIAAKFASNFLSISVIFLAASALFYTYTVTTFEAFSVINFSLMAAIVLLYVLMITAVTILASTLVRNSIVAGGIGFISFILFGTVFSLVGSIKPYSPNLIFSNYKDVVASGWSQDLAWPLAVIMFVIVTAVFVAVLFFRKQEIER